MNIPYHSDDAKKVNKIIFETIYHAALERSCEIAQSRAKNIRHLQNYSKFECDIFKNSNDIVCREYKLNCVLKDDQNIINHIMPIPSELQIKNNIPPGCYSSFGGSPTSKGILQFDMWKVTPSNTYDWNTMKENIKKHGLRNSLLVAPMPTASTSQILGNNECFEPFTSNIYTRRTLAGDFVVANKYLMKELVEVGLWSDELKNNIILNRGSIQHIKGIPQQIKDKYKIVWEIPMKHMIDMSADRGAYICQSQSLNLWMEDPNYRGLTSMYFYGWKAGLKTGIYYLRRKPKHQPQHFTIDPTAMSTCEMCSG